MPNCEKCGLDKTCLHPNLKPEGPIETAEILIVGEAPGSDEDMLQRPLIGESGQILRKALVLAGIEIPIEYTNIIDTPIVQYVILHNVLACRPPHNATPTGKQIDYCFDQVTELIGKMPHLKLIVPTGNVALRAFIGKQGITSLSGKEMEWNGFKLMPLIHPASILYAKNRSKLDEFNAHIGRIPAILNNSLVTNNFGKWSKINNLQEWKELKQILYGAGYFIYDLETTGLNPFWNNQTIKMISFSVDDYEAFALVFDRWTNKEWTEIFNDLRELFEDDHIGKIGQNIKFDNLWLRAILDINVKGVIGDTKLSQYTLYPNRSNHLKDMAWEIGLGGYEKGLEDALKNASISIQDAPTDTVLIQYGCMDSIVTHRIFNIHRKLFMNEPKLYKGYKDLLVPVSSVLSTMEYNGIRANPPRLHISSTKTDIIIGDVLQKIKQYPTIEKFEHKNKAEFNPNSHVQLREIFFGEKYENLDSIKKTKKKKQPSTDKDVLEYYKDTNALAGLLYTYSQYNAMQKFCASIKENLTPDNRIHTTYWLTTTISGRSSSTDPNLQNLPKGIKDLAGLRKIFVADKDFILAELDFSQMELRCMAEEAQDDVLRDAVLSGDVHRATAAAVLNKAPELVTEDERRNIGKTMVFQVLYGATEHGVARVMKCDIVTAISYLHKFFEKYYKTKQWMDETTEFVKENGYVTIRSGFKKYFPNYQNLSDHEIRSAMNAPIQGLAGHILFMALIGVNKFLETNGFKTFISLEIHDSIVMNIHKTELDIIPEISNIMEICHLKYMPDFKVPMKVDIKVGDSLGELVDYK